MNYGSVITTAGKAKIIAAAAAGTKVNITKFAVGDGDGAAYTPSSVMTALKNSCYTGDINAYKIDPNSANTMVVECMVPAGSGGYTIREIGLFDADDDLIALSNTPDIVKAVEAEGAVSDFIFNLQITVSDASAVEIVVDSAVVTASKSYVDAGLAEKVTTPTGGSAGNVLAKTADGTQWKDLQTDIDGKITAPSTGSAGQFLSKTASGTQWADVTIPEYEDATTTEHGLMSAADKVALAGKQDKYVNSQASITTTWTGSAAPFTQTFQNAEVTATCVVEVSLASSATQAQYEAFGALMLADGGQAAGSFTMKAWGDKNTAAIPIVVTVWR